MKMIILLIVVMMMIILIIVDNQCPQISFLSLIPRIWAEMNPLSLSSETDTHCNEIETTGLRTGTHC